MELAPRRSGRYKGGAEGDRPMAREREREIRRRQKRQQEARKRRVKEQKKAHTAKR